jgi:hypothetical protein
MHQTQRFSQMAQCAAAISVMLVAPMLVMNYQGVADDFALGGGTADLDIDYIEAELALIQANLAYVLRRNKRSPGYYPNSFVEELRMRARRFDEWRRQLETQDPKFTNIDILRAEGDLALARLRLQEDETVRNALPDSVSDAQIKRRRLAVEAARIWLEKVRDPSFEKLTDAERNRWRLVLLRKEIIDRRIERCR